MSDRNVRQTSLPDSPYVVTATPYVTQDLTVELESLGSLAVDKTEAGEWFIQLGVGVSYGAQTLLAGSREEHLARENSRNLPATVSSLPKQNDNQGHEIEVKLEWAD